MSTRIPFDESYWEEYLSGQEASLPALPALTQLTPRVTRLLAGNPGVMQLQGTNTYLVGTGASRILIDTGEGRPIWHTMLVEYLREHCLTLEYVLVTHWHGDHVGGIADLIKHSPTLQSRIYKYRPDRGQLPIADGQQFKVAGATVRAVFTPGHAIDHMCFLIEEENALLTGDNVLGHGFAVVQDLTEYMGSLVRMAALGCARGYPAHGAVIDDLPAKMQLYIHHNEARVQQVTAVLAETMRQPGRRGGMTVPEIGRAIYGEVPREIIENAIVPFLSQVLWKLADDRKVGFEPGETTERRWFGLVAR
ncbi:Metallo-hydrolase/oxidoreductase [Aspergillus eucalypticola CBS 122712]|uniref:Metallo-hydrolase/oxidoreductase n=1 Tax=Aspergillus eucalypticola (strain CBS 122712 / IBT 29274) TaxID=1448314 RepID=A0A317V188_ASPEC|nr:Metallo-hydrolase/oxidoreductase [Aspergillus eucalypticola CBS 122712]PWY67726.1 Metallo-hydrolase/oxidoreductase [Aspergillus eucalypticola CBS 122712]